MSNNFLQPLGPRSSKSRATTLAIVLRQIDQDAIVLRSKAIITAPSSPSAILSQQQQIRPRLRRKLEHDLTLIYRRGGKTRAQWTLRQCRA